MLTHDETPALAARARLAARAVVGLVLDEQRSARFVYEYSSAYLRQGVAGEAERKAALLSAIERESLLLVAARIERALPRVVASRFSRLAEPEAVIVFRQAFLAFLGGSLAWDLEERESFRKDLALYLRLAERESRTMGQRPGAPVAGAFVDRCAFLIDPSMMTQAREAASRYQAQLELCADQALRAAFRGLRTGNAAPALLSKSAPKPPLKPKPEPEPLARPKTGIRPRLKKSLRRRKPSRAAKPAKPAMRRLSPDRGRRPRPPASRRRRRKK